MAVPPFRSNYTIAGGELAVLPFSAIFPYSLFTAKSG